MEKFKIEIEVRGGRLTWEPSEVILAFLGAISEERREKIVKEAKEVLENFYCLIAISAISIDVFEQIFPLINKYFLEKAKEIARLTDSAEGEFIVLSRAIKGSNKSDKDH